MKKIVKVVLGGLGLSMVLILVSSILHGIVFHSLWESVEFMRPTDIWPFMPGAPISTIVWCIIISWFYSVIKGSLPSKGFLKGVVYGLYLCILFVLFVEVWTYLQFELPFMAAIAGVVVYLIALPLGCGVISLINEKI